MKISCAEFTFPLLPQEKALSLLNLLGFEGVDLGIFAERSHVQPAHILADLKGSIARMNQLLAGNHLVAADVFVQTGAEPPLQAANDPDKETRDNNRRIFQAMLEFTIGIGCKHLTGLPGVWHSGVEKEADWALAVEEARWRKQQAAACGIEYGIEPHVGSMLPDPESALRFHQQTGLTFTLDYGHFVYQGMAPKTADILLPYTSHFHARGGCKGQLQSTVKDNTIDFRSIVQQLNARGYDGWYCLEYVWIDWEGCNRTDNLSETLLLRDLLDKGPGLLSS